MSDMCVTCLGTERALVATVEPSEAFCSVFGIVKTRVNEESVKPCVVPNAQSETTCLQGHLAHVTFQGGECWQEEECRSNEFNPNCLITKTTASLLLEPTDECIVPNIRDEGEDCLWNEQRTSGVCYDHIIAGRVPFAMVMPAARVNIVNRPIARTVFVKKIRETNIRDALLEPIEGGLLVG